MNLDKSIMIDLVVLEFHTEDPEFIQRQVEEIFEYSLTISEIKDYFEWSVDYEMESYTVEMGEIFKEYEQES